MGETHKQEVGRLGEDLACEFLEKSGYKILERNLKLPWGELDVIAKAKDKTIIFVEVKALKGGEDMFEIFRPEDHMNHAKIGKVSKLANFYSSQHPEILDEKRGWRIDLVAVEIWESGANAIRHYQNL